MYVHFDRSFDYPIELVQAHTSSILKSCSGSLAVSDVNSLLRIRTLSGLPIVIVDSGHWTSEREKFSDFLMSRYLGQVTLPKLCIRFLGLGRFRILNLQQLTISSIRLGNGPQPLQKTFAFTIRGSTLGIGMCACGLIDFFTHLSSGTLCTCGRCAHSSCDRNPCMHRPCQRVHSRCYSLSDLSLCKSTST